jgi:hypothetical protein
MHLKTGLLCLAILCLAMVRPAAEAQVLYGSIVGNVRDASDAVVVGARVVITHTESKQSRAETTNVMGGYSFATLPPGTYDLRVTKEGFTTLAAPQFFLMTHRLLFRTGG